MELFNEIYSCYYHTVRHILAEAAGHSVNMKEMEQICKNQAPSFPLKGASWLL